MLKEDFFSAVQNGDISFVEKAIKADHNMIDAQSDATKQTALHMAISTCNFKLVDLLVASNANCYIEAQYRITPLMAAAACSELKSNEEKGEEYIKIISILLKKSIEDKSENWRDKTAAINVLGRKKNLSEEMICLLIELFEDNNWHVKTAIIKVLGLQEGVSKNLMACIVPLIKKAQRDESCKESWHIRGAADKALDTLKKKYPEIEDSHLVSSLQKKSLLKPDGAKNEPPQSKTFFPNIFGWFSVEVQAKGEEQPLIKEIKLKQE